MSTSSEPSPAAERLRAHVGTWDVECHYEMEPGADPFVTNAVETVTPIGELWTTSRFEVDLMGAPLVGSATLGFDFVRECWVSTWVDSLSPCLFRFEGAVDADGVLTMRGEGLDPATQAMTSFRTVERALGPDRREFEMFAARPEGGERRMFRYVYSRRD